VNRGLKSELVLAQIQQQEAVAVDDPVNRGLKSPTLVPSPDPWDVAVDDPVNRGLKSFPPRRLNGRQNVAVDDPVNRGLKCEWRQVQHAGRRQLQSMTL